MSSGSNPWVRALIFAPVIAIVVSWLRQEAAVGHALFAHVDVVDGANIVGYILGRATVLFIPVYLATVLAVWVWGLLTDAGE